MQHPSEAADREADISEALRWPTDQPHPPLSAEAKEWRDGIERDAVNGDLSAVPSVGEQLREHCERLGLKP